VYQKRGKQAPGEHRTKSQLAAEVVSQLARWFPAHKTLVVGDCA